MTIKVQIKDIIPKAQRSGKEPENNSPACSYCRKLVAEGVPESETLEVYRGEKLAYTVGIGWGSRHTIRENSKIGPIHVKYIPDTRFKTVRKPSP